jgi:cation diffusion facilitator CzcD-associated flavoprotein CzcO
MEKTNLPEFDAVVVGAGFAGLYMLYRLRDLGFAAIVYEGRSAGRLRPAANGYEGFAFSRTANGVISWLKNNPPA